MKIGIIGASGKAGSFILNEAIDRGHEVTAIVRNSAKILKDNIAIVEKNLFDLKKEDLVKFDVVVNAFKAPNGQEHQHIDAGRVLLEALKNNQETRLIVVGGAGSYYVDESNTSKVFEILDFPKAYLPTAKNMGDNLEELKNSTGIQWTYISPGGFFDPEGNRNGTYLKGKDQLILNAKGESYISYADYAIAVLDEIENPMHKNERFAVVGER
ncbi:LOW QUALITY PROTEIN: Rrf2-linked NADH-flavin reductase [Bacillus sp. JCM 19047]|nr:LOW QUALITY PROTEIN: Rrf2-linked NADH-flavin reductase [Bacillus sp. JCM 19047]